MNMLRILSFLFLLLCFNSLGAQSYQGCFSQKVNALENDAIEYGNSSGDVIIDAFGMSIVESWSSQIIGVRFTDIPIPHGSTIKKAYLQFYCKDPDDSQGPSNLTVQCELNSDSAPFAVIQKNISNRSKTVSAINWEPDVWRLKEYGGIDERTNDLSPIVQEVIDLNNWSPNSSLTFIISGEGKRSANNFFSGNPPLLYLEYESPNPTIPVTNIYINEIAANGTSYEDETGDFEDWIELYNDNNFPINVGGLFISDKSDEPEKWQISAAREIPAKGFLILNADKSPKKGGLHLNFALNKNGETIVLSQKLNGQFNVIDSITYASMPFRSTYARENEQIGNWMITGSETPNAPNGISIPYLEAPVIDLAGGFYTNEQTVTLTHSLSNVSIRYSLDGSVPDETSALYSSPILIGSNLSLRAKAFKTGYAESRTSTASYLFELPAELPVLMITTDPKNLFDPTIGIFVEGDGSAEPVYRCTGFQTANYYQNWERPAHLSFIENDGDLGFSVDAGIRVSGNCSRKYALRSLNIYLRNNVYGNKDIEYELFPDRETNKFSRLKLRNSGQDYRSTMMRDATNQEIMAMVPTYDYQSYQPTVVYINGEYWGIQNFREKYNEDFFKAHYDLDHPADELDAIDLLKNQEFIREIRAGDDIHFQNMLNYISDNDMSTPTNWDYIQTQLDINSFMDHWISMLYIANSDWPANNKQIWRPKTVDGKWRWVVIDTDGSTNASGPFSVQGHTTDKLNLVLQDDIMGWPNDSRTSLIFRKLMTNQNFKSEFIQRACSFMEIVFDKDRVTPIIDKNEDRLIDDMQAHLDRWAFDNPNLFELDDWIDNVGKMRNFYNSRAPFFRDNIRNNLAVNDSIELSFNYDSETEGNIYIHWSEMEIPYNYSGTYFSNLPIKIKAVAKDGFTFQKWLETGETNSEINFSSAENAILTPIFDIDLSDGLSDLSLNQLDIKPNPAKNFINISTGDVTQGILTIINQSTGVMIYEKQISNNNEIINTEHLSSGVYVVKIESHKGSKQYGRFTLIQ